MRGKDIDRLCKANGWVRSRLIRELRVAARMLGMPALPENESLGRMIRQWVNGSRDLSEYYATLLTQVFGVSFEAGPEKTDAEDLQRESVTASDLLVRLQRARVVVDAELLAQLELQTDGYRVLDRRLGAERLLAQTTAHVEQMTDLLHYSLPSAIRPALAGTAAEAAALAGWQALDLGRPDESWHLHATARALARESNDPAVLAHVTAQQAYALLDLEQPADALTLVQHARQELGTAGPQVLQAWVMAAEGEVLAAAGDEPGCRNALDAASRLVEGASADTSLPYVFLDAVHLGRWRGNCLARLGSRDAIDELTESLAGLDRTFTRASAALHCDLAMAYEQRGDHEQARSEARIAGALAQQTASVRQRRRIRKLAVSGSQR